LAGSINRGDELESPVLRGGVFVGVDRTKGGMPTLRAAASSAKKMYDWAIGPAYGAMDLDAVRLLSDADGAVVTVEQVKTAVREVIGQGVDQLILYFSGHGMIINNLETWLLSDAPDDGDAAISVTRSAQAARFGVTPHVVIVSDACRTPAQELQTQSVSGASVFPNNPTEAPEKRVDVFYATAPGRAALELNTTDSQGIYTEVLHEALTGAAPEVLESGDAADGARYLWSGPLGEYLETAVAERLIALNIDRDQTPKFDVQYGKKNLRWLARVLIPAARGGVPRSPIERQFGAPPMRQPRHSRGVSWVDEAVTVTQVAEGLVQAIAGEPETSFDEHLARAQQAPAPGTKRFVDSVKALAQPFSRSGADAEVAIRVRGAQFITATSDGAVHFDGPERIEWQSFDGRHPANVLVEFDNGTTALIPALPDHITDITVHDREIVAVSFESPYGPSSKLDEIRQVRAVVAASVRQGRFRLADNGLDVARGLQVLKGEDPALAVYAAYSYYEMQAHERTQQMNDALLDQLNGYMLFDVALLAGYLNQRMPQHTVLPFVPLLVQGWELLDSLGIDELEWFERVRPMVLPSLWTVFDISARDDLMEMMRAIGPR
jgi:Caspase domain